MEYFRNDNSIIKNIKLGFAIFLSFSLSFIGVIFCTFPFFYITENIFKIILKESFLTFGIMLLLSEIIYPFLSFLILKLLWILFFIKPKLTINYLFIKKGEKDVPIIYILTVFMSFGFCIYIMFVIVYVLINKLNLENTYITKLISCILGFAIPLPIINAILINIFYKIYDKVNKNKYGM